MLLNLLKIGWEIYLLKKKYILIKNKYDTNYSIYYDTQKKCFMKRKESTSKSIYFFSILFIVFVRGFNDIKIEYSFWLVLLTAIILGGVLGVLFYKLDQHLKTKSFEKANNSYEAKENYVFLGRALLSNQIKVFIACIILFFIITIMLFFSTTTKNFLGVTGLSFILIYFFNFCAPVEKQKIFSHLIK